MKQAEYLSLFEAGYTVSEIASMKHVNKSTVSRTLTRGKNKKCPFSSSCNLCPLDDCAISDGYAFFFNGNDRKRNQHYKHKEPSLLTDKYSKEEFKRKFNNGKI